MHDGLSFTADECIQSAMGASRECEGRVQRVGWLPESPDNGFSEFSLI